MMPWHSPVLSPVPKPPSFLFSYPAVTTSLRAPSASSSLALRPPPAALVLSSPTELPRMNHPATKLPNLVDPAPELPGMNHQATSYAPSTSSSFALYPPLTPSTAPSSTVASYSSIKVKRKLYKNTREKLHKNTREKLRRGELNTKFVALQELLQQGAKVEKSCVLSEAITVITTLRQKIDELKAEKRSRLVSSSSTILLSPATYPLNDSFHNLFMESLPVPSLPSSGGRNSVLTSPFPQFSTSPYRQHR
jgi:Helix-loop-helix DNA-binding domain